MKIIGSRKFLLLLSIITAIFFSYVIFNLKMLPMKYYIPMVIVVFGIVFLLYRGEKDKTQEHQVRVAVLKVINVLLAIVMMVGSLYAMKGSDLISSITGGGDQTLEMNVVVLKDSPYQKLNDLKGKTFVANTAVDAININKTQAFIEDEIGNIHLEKVSTNIQAVTVLENKQSDAMIIKAVDLQSLNEVEENFDEKIRVIHKIELKLPSVEATSAEVTKEPFHVLISGTDQEGPIGTFALSDVNLLATINPVTKQVLLTSIPRDYYVDIKGMEGVEGKDKLTHSAKGGMNCTLQTVENLMGIKINYYAKFNFTSFMNVVDALGGITVDVPKYAVKDRDDGVFVTKKGKYTIKPGINQFNAKQALCFVRERKAFVKGDAIRGKNQMIMLKAIIKKCCSPAIITKMDKVFSSVADSFETNMSANDIKSLIQMQIDDMSSWDIQSYRLDGDPSQKSSQLATIGTVTTPGGLYITVPYEESLRQSQQYIDSVVSGEILKIEE